MEVITTEIICLTDEENECLQKARDLLSTININSMAEGDIENATFIAIEALDEVCSFVVNGVSQC